MVKEVYVYEECNLAYRKKEKAKLNVVLNAK